MGVDWRRVRHLLRARAASGPRGGAPVAALLAQAVVASFLCALVRDALPPFAYGLFAFSLTGSLVAIPLLGELGWILRRDEAAEWVGALPVGARELALARTLHLAGLLWLLALGSLVPAAVFAPDASPGLARLALPLLGLGLTTFLAALLLVVQNALGERAESLLVAFQTVLVVGVVVGFVLGLRNVPFLARVPTLGDAHAPFLWLLPPSWFAAPLAANEGQPPRWWLPAGVLAASLLVLLRLPRVAARRSVDAGWSTALLAPARWLATRLWVRPDERGPFDLAYDALPREREVVLRTVPMVGIPLAFLVVAGLGEAGGGSPRSDVLALITFSAGIYLPILLTHVPATATPGASWLMDGAPVPEGAVEAGTLKALAVRFLVPLYLVLGFLVWVQAGPERVLVLALPGFGVSLFVMRRLYPVCVGGRPLSTAPDRIRFDLDWAGVLGGLALVLPLLAVLANRLLDPAGAVVVLLLLLAAELGSDRALRRRRG